MSLTSPATQTYTAIAAVVFTIAVLVLWNRVRGPRAVRFATRAGLLTGCYLVTAAAVLVTVNIAYGGLIVSVGDLFSDPNQPMGGHGGHHAHPPDWNPADWDPADGTAGNAGTGGTAGKAGNTNGTVEPVKAAR
jgi:hypothetical protein